MYREVGIREALNAALDGKTVFAVSTLIPNDKAPEMKYITNDIMAMAENGDRFIVDDDGPKETESKIDTPSSDPETVSENSEKPKKKKGKPGPKHDVDVGKINALHEAGWSVAKIADEMNLSKPTVRKYLTGVELECEEDEE